MASSASANTANTDGSLKRTLTSSGARPTKRPKRETKLDRLKAEQKSEAGNLKTKIELVLGLIEGKGVANEFSLKIYVDSCNHVLGGMELHEVTLEMFEMPFADHFKPDDVLLKILGPCMLPLCL